MRVIRHFAPWVIVLVLFGVLVSLLPGTTFYSVLITQIPLVPVTGLVVYGFFHLGQVSEKAAKITIAFVALAGLSFAIYLGVTWATGAEPTCSVGGGCQVAQSSEGADLFFGIRTTTVGIVGYSLVLLSLLLRGNLGRMATAFLGTFGFGTSAYLTIYLATEFQTSCQWCLGSAAAMTTIMALSYWRLAKFLE